jgi:polyhydroxyalkanoate synthesis regulator protein
MADYRPEVLIKRYDGRRLYNTETATYVSLDELAEMLLGVKVHCPGRLQRARTLPAIFWIG